MSKGVALLGTDRFDASMQERKVMNWIVENRPCSVGLGVAGEESSGAYRNDLSRLGRRGEK